MKKLIYTLTVFIITIFLVCCNIDMSALNKAKTELVIQNQSSINIKEIKYSGRTLVTEAEDSFVLVAGSVETLQLNAKGNGYVYFTIMDTINDEEIKVRSSEVITIEQGQKHIFTITDNTVIVPIGSTAGLPIIKLIKPTRLKLINKTGKSIDNITYAGKTKKDPLINNEVWKIDFPNPVSGKLQFQIWSQDENKSLSVTLKDEVVVRKDETTKVILTTSSLVIQEGKNEVVSIGKLLGISVLKILNRTSAKEIKNFKYAGILHNEMLTQGQTCEFEYDFPTNSYLSFTIISNSNDFIDDFIIKTTDKIVIEKGEEQTFTLTDDTGVLVDDVTEPTIISSILNAASLKIINDTSTILSNVTYDDFTFPGDWGAGSQMVATFWNFPPISPKNIILEIKILNGRIKVKTVESFFLSSNREATYTFTDDTIVILEGTSKEVPIKNLL